MRFQYPHQELKESFKQEITVRSAYAELDLYQLVEGGAGRSATPGELSVDDLLKTPSTPFINELQAGKKQGPNKTIILDYLSLPAEGVSNRQLKIYKLKILMAIRQLIRDDFKVYQYRNNIPHLLTNLSLSQVFDFNDSNAIAKKQGLKRQFIADVKTQENKELEVSSVCSLDADKLSQLFDAIPTDERVLWQSDSNAVEIYENEYKKYGSNSFTEMLITLKIKQCFLNVCCRVDDYQISSKGVGGRAAFVRLERLYYESLNKYSHNVLSNHYDWQSLEEVVVKQLSEDDSEFFQKLSQATKLKKLCFGAFGYTDSYEVDIEQLLNPNLVLDQLEILDLGFNIFSAHQLKKIFEKFNNLKKVSYAGEKLDLTDKYLELSELELFLPSCENLTELLLYSTENFIALIQSGKNNSFSQLKKINFLHGKFSQEEFSLIEKAMPNLEEINLQLGVYLADKIKLGEGQVIQRILNSFPAKLVYFNAETLDLADASSEKDAWSPGMSLAVLRGQRNLKSVSLWYQEGFFDCLASLEEVNFHLKSLTILGGYDASPEQVKVILEKFPNLNSIAINISGEDFEDYAKTGLLKQIEYADFGGRRYPAHQVEMLSKAMPQLMTLSTHVFLECEEDESRFVGAVQKLEKINKIRLELQDISSRHMVRVTQGLAHINQIVWVGSVLDLSDEGCDKATLEKIVLNASCPDRLILNSVQDFMDVLLENPRKIGELQFFVRFLDFGDKELYFDQLEKLHQLFPNLESVQCKIQGNKLDFGGNTNFAENDEALLRLSENVDVEFTDKPTRGLGSLNAPNQAGFEDDFEIDPEDQAYDIQEAIGLNESCYGDANTKSDRSKEFNLNRIFYDVSSPDAEIPVRDYRLQSYNTLDLVASPRNIRQVFECSNSGNINLVNKKIKFMAQDVYLEAKLDAKQAQKNNPDKKIHYAKTKLLLNGRWQALPSLKANDVITKVHLDPSVDVDIQYSQRDNLYFIRRKNLEADVVDIDYVVESDPAELPSLSDLPQAVREVVRFCKMEFGEDDIDLSKLSRLDGRDCILAIANQRQGACRHKSYLLKAILDNPSLLNHIDFFENKKLNLKEFEEIEARIIDNDCHTYIELRDTNSHGWVRCDLGGQFANLNIRNNDFHPEDYVQEQEKNTAEQREILPGTSIASVEKHDSKDLAKPERLVEKKQADARNTDRVGQSDSGGGDGSGYDPGSNIDAGSEKGLAVPVASVNQDDEEVPIFFPEVEQQEILSAGKYIHKLLATMGLNKESKRLIECAPEQLAGFAEKLENYFQDTSQNYYTVRSPEDLVLNRPHVELDESNIGKVKKEGYTGPLYDFLTDESISGPRTLIVDFSRFTVEETARFNSLLDSEPSVPSIDGVPLPDGTKIIALTELVENDEDKDASLYSRFERAVEQCAVNPDEFQGASLFTTAFEDGGEEDDSLVIDFYGLSNWKSKLLGYWNIQGADLQFVPSSLLEQLQNKTPPRKLILKNPPKNNVEFVQFFKDVQLKKNITHEGRKFSWGIAELVIEDKLEFAAEAINRISRAPPESNSYVLNPSTFPGFLKQYKFVKTHGEQGYLFEEDGLLKWHASSDDSHKVFNIYLTENLTDGQWSALLAESSKLGVQLNICLAPNVVLSEQLAGDKYHYITSANNADISRDEIFQCFQNFSSDTMPSRDCCIASVDADFTIDQWRVAQPESAQKNIICIDVSELAISDLLVKTKGGLSQQEEGFEFSRNDGALLKLLDDSKTVILHGEFSTEVRQWLQDFLYKRNSESHQDVNRKGQVVIVSEDELVSSFTHIANLHHHSIDRAHRELCFIEKKVFERHELIKKRKAERIKLRKKEPCHKVKILEARERSGYEGLRDDLPVYTPETDVDLSIAEQVTNDIDAFRLAEVEDGFVCSPYVFLAGITGTGKTSFIEKVWRNKAEGRRLYIGEAEIKQWLLDRDPGTKALFFTEANIGSENWSRFEGLFNNNPLGMVIGDRYVELTKDHKVFFDGNPASYSSDRHLPSLFARHGNSIVFDPLPSEYIYQKMLLPLFDNNIVQAEKICQPILALNLYLNALEKNTIILTPRELIMMAQLSIDFCENPGNARVDPAQVAKYYSYQIAKNFVPEKHCYNFNKKFHIERPAKFNIELPEGAELTVTASNESSMHMLTDFLSLRQKHVNNGVRLPPAGLGGVTIEGMPGLGKTTLAIACLKSLGMNQRSLEYLNKENKSPPPSDKKYFYYFPAGMNVKLKKEYLIRAFHEGAVVLCDEINTAKSLEGLLNRLLMGEGPEGERPDNPGFMLISTQNPAGKIAGRSSTSLAQLHRMHYSIIADYSESEMHLILEEMGLPERLRNGLINQYLQKKEVNQALCFRDVITIAKNKIKALLGDCPKKISIGKLMQLANDPNSTPDILEAVYLHRKCSNEIKLALVTNRNINVSLLKKIVFDQNLDNHQEILFASLSSPAFDDELLKYIKLAMLECEKHDPNLISAVIEKLYSAEKYLDISRLVQNKDCDASVALQVAQHEKVSEKILRDLVANIAFYPEKKNENKFSFFSRSSSSRLVVNDQYPVSAIFAMLKLLQLEYSKHKGEHKTQLSDLIDNVQAKSEGQAVSVRDEINNLTKGWKLGKPGGSGRLKKALLVMLDNMKHNQPLSTNSVLECVYAKSASADDKSISGALGFSYKKNGK